MHGTRLLLRIMLWSLGLAGVVGAIAVLSGATDTYWRVVGTLFTLAVSAGLLILVSRMRTPAPGAASVLATALILTEFVLAMVGIWDLEDRLGLRDWRLFELMFVLFGAGFPAIFFLRYVGDPSGKLAGIVGLALCAVVLAMWVVAIYQDAAATSSWKWWQCAWTLGGIGVLGPLSLIGAGTDRRHWRWIGVGAAAVASALGIWLVVHDMTAAQPLIALVSVAVVVADANVVLRVAMRANQKWLAYGSIGAAAACAICINISIWGRDYSSALAVDSASQRLASAAAILAACATLAVAILAIINRKAVPAPGAARELLKTIQITVVCPVCHHKQVFGQQGGTCDGCGLRIRVSVEEPVCPACGYSLLMLKRTRCPECGADAAIAPVAAIIPPATA